MKLENQYKNVLNDILQNGPAEFRGEIDKYTCNLDTAEGFLCVMLYLAQKSEDKKLVDKIITLEENL